MSGEMAVPLLPCGSIDVMEEFYRALGFERTYRQLRPNPHLAMRREDLHLHFFGMPDFVPEQSYGSCLVIVPDTGALHQAFATGLRAAYGKVPVAGIPRMTRPRKRKNAGDAAGFTVVDPGGNWIRIFPSPAPAGTSSAPAEAPAGSAEVPIESAEALAEPAGSSPGSGATPSGPAPAGSEEVPVSRLATALSNAVVLGDSKGDDRQAARILDATLAREQDATPVTDLVEALAYRAELAVRLGEDERAGALLARLAALPLTEADRRRSAGALAGARDLAEALGGPAG
ncbi:hypothetical protein Sru01_47640 [Sphaerisporangium rufum]|uniref:VOC family protein n=1 Tax=Sphaerisporangium rufum TaxID=1381558 RepID=A0A919V2J9_9ACTN|nr:VOC family protein [Sphaerisporangium rufum]GII79782.1 hypothetical protein Sru01_47640 [Sphaerisporangium rufum]